MRGRELLAENVRRRRRALGLSQEELAHRAGLDRNYVGSLERCEYAASIDSIEKLAGVLGAELHEMLRPVEGPAPDPPPGPRKRGRPIR